MSAMRSASSMTTTSTCVEPDIAPADQIGQPPRAGDGDVDAAAQRLELALEAVAAVEGLDPGPAGTGQQDELLADLRGQLAGGHEHQGARPAGLAAPDARDERDAEGDGLAGPGRRLAAEVTAGEPVGQRGRLDRERCCRCRGRRGRAPWARARRGRRRWWSREAPGAAGRGLSGGIRGQRARRAAGQGADRAPAPATRRRAHACLCAQVTISRAAAHLSSRAARSPTLIPWPSSAASASW